MLPLTDSSHSSTHAAWEGVCVFEKRYLPGLLWLSLPACGKAGVDVTRGVTNSDTTAVRQTGWRVQGRAWGL